DKFTLYIFDRKKDITKPYSTEEIAKDTGKAIKALGLKNVNVFGASQGGMMALWLAAKEKELVEKIVIASTTPKVCKEEFEIIDEWIKLAKEKRIEELYLSFCDHLFAKNMREELKESYREASRLVKKEEIERFIFCGEGMRYFDISKQLETISCPMLITADRDDDVFGFSATTKIIQYLSKQCPYRLEISEGYGHAAYDVSPHYKEMILNFLLEK
ncbi:MAG: alpha/beta hydrolase, partial [Solobacterium sp.]|nr:alpha/beta hydrolase [Solobacterium sp.]